MIPAYIFIRDDDVQTLERGFSEFFSLFLTLRLPVVYAVIPGLMQSALVDTLKRQKGLTPYLLDIVQHGWRHIDYSCPGARKYEFGGSRSEKEQETDLSLGLMAMKESFGDMFVPFFVPPFHGYDVRTLALIKRCGLKGFSAEKRMFVAGEGLLDVPINFTFKPKDYNDQPVDVSVELQRLTRLLRAGRMTGILCHHEEFAGDRGQEALRVFFKAIACWRDKGKVKVILLSDILRKSGFAKKGKSV